jgi:histidyl-tRNA synthetase
MYKAPRGTSDILPEDQQYWKYVTDSAIAVGQLYGYKPLETPAFEDAQLFSRSGAEGTDIADKEMYIFTDRGGQKLALKAEGTAPTCRAYLEHGMFNLPQPVKLYYITSCFRYERPQAGRFRQHHQCGFEAIGDADPLLDAEVIDLSQRFLRMLGIAEFSIGLNSIGCQLCQPNYIKILRAYYSQHEAMLCPDCKVRLLRNPLRLLDCKKKTCQEIANDAPKITDFLCPDCQAHFKGVQYYLAALGIPFTLKHRLVRGLDYYSRTVFELETLNEKSQSALGGGGRYDNLIEQLGGSPTPAVGFATGIERLVLNLKEKGIAILSRPAPVTFIAYLGAVAKLPAIKLSARLRASGIPVVLATGAKSLKAQLRQANSFNTSYTIIIGEQELNSANVVLRDMKAKKQELIPLANIDKTLLQKQSQGQG